MEAASSATVAAAPRRSTLDEEFDPFEFDDFNDDMDAVALNHQPAGCGVLHGSLNAVQAESFQPPASTVVVVSQGESLSHESPGGFESARYDDVASSDLEICSEDFVITPPQRSHERELPIFESALPMPKKVACIKKHLLQTRLTALWCAYHFRLPGAMCPTPVRCFQPTLLNNAIIVQLKMVKNGPCQ